MQEHAFQFRCTALDELSLVLVTIVYTNSCKPDASSAALSRSRGYLPCQAPPQNLTHQKTIGVGQHIV
jgi:hypothetical protein